MRHADIFATGHCLSRLFFLRAILFFAVATSWNQISHGAEAWNVRDADLRFSLKLADRPTHESAGYFVQLPDGGILPGPHPITTVVAMGGKGKDAKPQVLESYTFWHSKTDGLSLVFADPGKNVESVDIYVSGSPSPRPWTPATGLTPSAILCANQGVADLSTARSLARLGVVKDPMHIVNNTGFKKAPFSIGGDESGRPRPASFYFLTHVVVNDPGQTWIAPFVIDGECEVRVNGKKLTPTERIDKWGGTGEYFELTKGLHRIEVFQTAPGSGPYASNEKDGGLMYLTWRTPNATMKELGGVRSDKVPMAGTSRMETRVLKNEEIVRSGGCTLEGAVTRTGAAVASVKLRPTHTFWFEGEAPLVVYELRALTAGHPAGTTYHWELPGGARVEGPETRWVFPGFFENAVTLTAKSGTATSKFTKTFFGFGPGGTSMGNPADRKAFRDALTIMVTSYSRTPDPVASWNSSLWNNLIRTTEQGHGYDLLLSLFTTRLDTLKTKLSLAQFLLLQDVFLDMLQQRKPQDALLFIDTLLKTFPEGPQRDNLLIRKAQIYMIYLNDRDAAARGLAAFSQRTGEIAEWSLIRLGDLAFLSGDLNKATELYAGVQKRARSQRNQLDRLATDAVLDNKSAKQTGNKSAEQTGAKPPIVKGGIRQSERNRNFSRDISRDKTPDQAEEVLPYRSADWRTGALRDVSNSENIATLIEGGFLLEARHALRNWEREFPLSKISGDLLLMEAEFDMKLGDWQRARVFLEAYCRNIDASSFLPEAARMLVICVRKTDSPREEVRDLIEKVAKRLKYHPVARELEEFLSSEK